MRSGRILGGHVGPKGLARLLTLALSAAALVAAPTHTVEAQEAPGALVRVVHGLRGLVADIYLNGQLVLPTFQPERSTDPMTVPAGDHLVEVRTAGAAMTEGPVLSQTVSVPSGFQGSLVAHLDSAGAPRLSAFADDLTAVPAGQSRLVVRHTAAVADISVLLDESPLAAAVAPSDEVARLILAGQYQLSVTPALGGDPLATPQGVDFAEGTANFMYLIGSQSDGTLGWAVVRLAGLETPPARIQTGDGSSAGSSPAWTAWGALAAATVLSVGAVRSRTRRSALAR